MASVEEIFNEKIDDLHHLKLASGAGDVVLEELLFVKQGTVNRWLTGEVFALGSPRSPAGELAIKDAKALQRREAPVLSEEVREVDKRLRRFLASDDDFWPRWRYFAEQHEAVE